jgi:hypothetical protein
MQPQAIHQRRLASADFTGERNKSFARPDPIHQAAQRVFRLFGREETARVWIFVERIFFSPKKLLYMIFRNACCQQIAFPTFKVAWSAQS